jgi:hypothetical protein
LDHGCQELGRSRNRKMRSWCDNVLVAAEVVGSSRLEGDRGVRVEQRSPGCVHFGTWLGTPFLDTDEGVVDSDSRGIGY